MTHPKTIAERLDAAQSGDEFGSVLNDLFGVLGRARDAEWLAEYEAEIDHLEPGELYDQGVQRPPG